MDQGNQKILIYGVIGSDGISAEAFAQEFQKLEQAGHTIHVHINSPGGSVWDGLAIFTTINSAKVPVYTHVDGIAYSMAAMIALAGHRVHMAKGSLLMLHNVSASEYGHAQKLRQTAGEVEKYDTILADLIATKSGKDLDFIHQNWLNFQDHYFSPAEALSAGLVDQIETHQANIPQNVQQLTYHQLVEAFQLNHQTRNQHMNPFKQILNARPSSGKRFSGPKNEDTLQETSSDQVASDLLYRLENCVLGFEGLLQSFEALLNEGEQPAELEDLPAKVDALRKRLDAMSDRRLQAYTAADFTGHSRPRFETSFDNEMRKALQK